MLRINTGKEDVTQEVYAGQVRTNKLYETVSLIINTPEKILGKEDEDNGRIFSAIILDREPFRFDIDYGQGGLSAEEIAEVYPTVLDAELNVMEV